MLNKEDLKKYVYDIINTHSAQRMDDSLLDKEFVADFGEDSLDIVEQCMELESTYNIYFDYYDVKECSTPRKLIEFAYKKIVEKERIAS
jgi:acyl carrier protein